MAQIEKLFKWLEQIVDDPHLKVDIILTHGDKANPSTHVTVWGSNPEDNNSPTRGLGSAKGGEVIPTLENAIEIVQLMKGR